MAANMPNNVSRAGSIANGPPSAGISQQPPSTPGGAAPTNQNLNNIVIEYLAKKGYTKTENALRKEEIEMREGRKPNRVDQDPVNKYEKAYVLLEGFVDDALMVYRPELIRLLWPIFVHSLLNLAGDFYVRQAEDFYRAHHERFAREHEDDLRLLSSITTPEHLAASSITGIYRSNKYRLSISAMAYNVLLQFLETHEKDGGSVIISLFNQHLQLLALDRATAGPEHSLAAMLSRRGEEWDFPAEDEGIPGHNPGQANTDPNAPVKLAKLALGPLPPDNDVMDDVRAEIAEEDAKNPPGPGEQSLMEALEDKIKKEPQEEGPSRDAVPLPPPLARDVAMEVQKIREHRDRFRIDPRSGGVPPGISVCMYTFHNTFDSINCLDFSADLMLIAAGSKMSYIQIWSIDGSPFEGTSLEADPNSKPVNSKRLIGHSGPVYSVSFAPSTARGPNSSVDTSSRLLLSASADKTVRLWSLNAWSCLVVYRAHDSPIWDVSWSPNGYYFLSCGNDRAARVWAQDKISPLRLFAAHDNDVDVGCWHCNGAYVFTAGDKNIRMWDIMKGTAVRMFSGHTGNITAVACSPDGQTLASADDQGAIFLWDLHAGTLRKRMRGHGKGGIWSLSWSVESSILVSGGADQTVRVWDVVLKQNQTQGSESKAIDGVSISAATGGVVSQKKSKKDVVVTADQISAFPTKKSPVYKVFFSRSNLVLAGSAYMPDPAM